MKTKEINSFIKVCRKNGKLSYQDAYFYYNFIINNRLIQFPTIRTLNKFNKLVSRNDLGITGSSNLVDTNSLSDFNDKLTYKNYIYLELIRPLIRSYISTGYKMSYKNGLYMYLLMLFSCKKVLSDPFIIVNDIDNVIDDIITTHTEIFMMWMSMVPDEYYPLVNRYMDLKPDMNKYKFELNGDYVYLFEDDNDEKKYEKYITYGDSSVKYKRNRYIHLLTNKLFKD